MANEEELKEKFWKALKLDRTVMLGLSGAADGHTRPMTALIEEDHGPLWFFTSIDSSLVTELAGRGRAIATFCSKGHDVFAAIHGTLSVDRQRENVDRLWNPYIAAWYDGGKDDPKLVLLRLDAEHAEIWKDASSIWAAVKILFGADPKAEYKDNVADVNLN
ncbi:general stress protein 26 [Ensifer sp. KUDG1]|uniref:pyridoxamine 5'-phosphate oxidase family protein n=1 Tax=Ensifer sp. KUDG1 TaxID=3373919 RepID=UPI003D1F31D1